MKKSIHVQIYKNGSNSDILLRLIGNYNDDKGQVSPRDIEGYLATLKCAYPFSTNSTLIKGESPNEYHISEDEGKTFTMSLEWVEVHELAETV